ncbi:MAG: chromate efflux transporter [Planctomycetota bacterium]
MSENSPEKASEQLPFGTAVRFWLKLGCISFGGPAGQVALMHRELVDRRRWISESRFLHALNYCLLLPGPEAQQLATYIGWLFHGIPGGIVAGGLFILPSLLLLTLLSGLYVAFGEQPLIAAALNGAKMAVVAIVVSALVKLARRSLRQWLSWSLAIVSFLSLSWLELPFPAVILLAGFVGFLAQRFGHPLQTARAPHPQHSPEPGSDTSSRYLHDDETAIPEHAQHSARRTIGLVVVGLLLWGIPLAGLLLWQGSSGTFTQMAIFFSVAALVTFGGAYAVLPYVAERAVDRAGWLSSEQMIDGLALGETTPGPLIMIVAFVGYLGGAQTTDYGVWGGMLGAAVAAWYTFLPSFFLIFLGAPLIEKSRGVAQLGSVLAGISAAVVGVIAQLALRFVLTTFWPTNESVSGAVWFRSADWFGIAFTFIAILLVLRYQANLIALIAAAIVFGLIRAIGGGP